MIKANKLKEILHNLLLTFEEYESLILSFSFSSEIRNYSSFLGGIRFLDKKIVVSIINPNKEEIKDWALIFKDLNIKRFFIDIDQKFPYKNKYDLKSKKIETLNFFEEASEYLKFAEIIPWSSTELTVNAAINTLRQELGNNLSKHEVSIIGLGRIGYQLSHNLLREGVKIHSYTRNYSLGLIKTKTLNLFNSQTSLASFNLYKSSRLAIQNSSVLVECSSSLNTINEEFIHDFRLHKLILDLGKYAFNKKFIKEIKNYNINFKRVDISNTFCEFIYSKLTSNQITKKKPTKLNLKGDINLISGGWKGLPGDIIVDDANNPRFVLGSINSNFQIDPIYKSFAQWYSSL